MVNASDSLAFVYCSCKLLLIRQRLHYRKAPLYERGFRVLLLFWLPESEIRSPQSSFVKVCKQPISRS